MAEDGKLLTPVDGEAHRIANAAYSEAWLNGAAENTDNKDREKQIMKFAREIEAYAEDRNKLKGNSINQYLEVGKDCSFGRAVEALRAGKIVSREGWNGKGMYLRLIRSGEYLIPETSSRDLLPWIGMKTADNKFVPWLASQTDILANDWCILN